jgi:hypothetical protein
MIGAGLVEISNANRNIASPPRPRTRAPFTFDRWIANVRCLKIKVYDVDVT